MASLVRTLIITQEDPFYIAEFFRAFLDDARRKSGVAEIVGAVILDTLGESGGLGLLRRMHALYGTVGVSKLAARYGIKRMRATAHGRLKLGGPVDVAQILAAAGVPVWRADDINSPTWIEKLRGLTADVFLSISATQKFAPDLLGIPRLGCFNSHSGALPRFRGMMPTFWTLYENEPHATVTIHRMAEKIDAGAIWRQGRLPIEPSSTLDDVIRETKRLSARLMWDLLESLRAGPISFQPNDVAKGSYYKFPTKRDSAVLRARGRRLL